MNNDNENKSSSWSKFQQNIYYSGKESGFCRVPLLPRISYAKVDWHFEKFKDFSSKDNICIISYQLCDKTTGWTKSTVVPK